MSGNSLLLDTNIVLYLLGGDEVLSNLLYDRRLYVSFITELELLGYPDITEAEKQAIRQFLEECIIIDINKSIKEEVIKLKQSRKIKLPDSIIIATSLYLDIPVMSADDDFNRITEADVVYYEPG